MMCPFNRTDLKRQWNGLSPKNFTAEKKYPVCTQKRVCRREIFMYAILNCSEAFQCPLCVSIPPCNRSCSKYICLREQRKIWISLSLCYFPNRMRQLSVNDNYVVFSAFGTNSAVFHRFTSLFRQRLLYDFH